MHLEHIGLPAGSNIHHPVTNEPLLCLIGDRDLSLHEKTNGHKETENAIMMRTLIQFACRQLCTSKSESVLSLMMDEEESYRNDFTFQCFL